MSIITQYREYLRDNPKGYWFKRKLFGWGWVPALWQGWAVIGLFVLYIAWVATGFANDADAGVVSNEEVTTFIIKIAIGVAVLLYVCYRKGEKPTWQWGVHKEL